MFVKFTTGARTETWAGGWTRACSGAKAFNYGWAIPTTGIGFTIWGTIGVGFITQG